MSNPNPETNGVAVRSIACSAWLKCQDNLPPMGENVLVTNGTEIAMLNRSPKPNGWYWSLPEWVGGMEADLDLDENRLTHWMPLPDMPNGADEMQLPEKKP